MVGTITFRTASDFYFLRAQFVCELSLAPSLVKYVDLFCVCVNSDQCVCDLFVKKKVCDSVDYAARLLTTSKPRFFNSNQYADYLNNL